jgi:hypothetical protein
MPYTEHTPEEMHRLQAVEKAMLLRLSDYQKQLGLLRELMLRGRWYSSLDYDSSPPDPHCYHCLFQARPGCRVAGKAYGAVCEFYVYHRETSFHACCGGKLVPEPSRLIRKDDGQGVTLYSIVQVCDKCGEEIPAEPVRKEDL